MIDQKLFGDALMRERKRADRFGRPFLLLLMAVKNSQRSKLPWALAIEALAAAKRDLDVLGWFEQGSVLGLILPEIDALDAAVVREVDARVRRELAARLDAETVARCSIGLQAYSGAHTAATPGAAPIPSSVGTFSQHGTRATLKAAFKRGLDVIGSLVLLAILSPLFLVIAALVKLTSAGPVLFRQVRVGQAAKPFTMLKFRTMEVNADKSIHQKYVTAFITSSGPAAASGSAEVFKIVNDPRISSIGRFLRRTSLDELPQSWNVLRGEMSLVGPRPPLPYEVEQYKPWHHRRLFEAKPGITGLWQVTGRSRTTFDNMVRLDLQYARTCSVWTDIKILLATPRAVLSGRGAH